MAYKSKKFRLLPAIVRYPQFPFNVAITLDGKGNSKHPITDDSMPTTRLREKRDRYELNQLSMPK
jgi:hypothetical protein